MQAWFMDKISVARAGRFLGVFPRGGEGGRGGLPLLYCSWKMLFRTTLIMTLVDLGTCFLDGVYCLLSVVCCLLCKPLDVLLPVVGMDGRQ